MHPGKLEIAFLILIEGAVWGCSSTAGCESTTFKTLVPISDAGIHRPGVVPGRPLTDELCMEFCHTSSSCRLVGEDAGAPMVECTEVAYCEGRRPAGLCPAEPSRESVLGRYFANAAHLEAASIDAFRQLREELSLHRAPPRLIGAVERARRDEVRHAKIIGALARRCGARVPSVVLRPTEPRSVDEIARDNAVEGRVREGYGALVKLWQARNARSPRLRLIFGKIARDEIRHAAVSFELARWTHQHLTRSQRDEVVRLERRALTELRAQASVAPGPDLVAEVGMPEPRVATSLACGLESLLADPGSLRRSASSFRACC